MDKSRRVLVTGGAGYVGAVLVPKLLQAGYTARVLDLFWYGTDVFDAVKTHPQLEIHTGDLRDPAVVERAVKDCEAVIHLACVSNDPSFDLDPSLGKTINYDAFEPLVVRARDAGVKRFIYASSSSVYGVKGEENVTEELPLEPLTDYSKFKALCEEILARYQSPDFTTVTVRPATVCGYSPRLRLDLSVNILTNHAINRGVITVFGGEQRRPNIHIEDITDLYVDLLARPAAEIAGKVWNAGYENHRLSEIAEIVRRSAGRPNVQIVTTPTDDLRSYHISSERIRQDLGFVPRYTLDDAVRELASAMQSGLVVDPLNNIRYFNIKTMQHLAVH